jgi:hypothetical protein
MLMLKWTVSHSTPASPAGQRGREFSLHAAACVLGRADQARRERKSAETKARGDDPEERSKLMAGIANPDNRNGIATAMRAKWADPTSRQEMIKQVKAGE